MKRIFLTGASAGIGRATAAALLAQGHEVWGTSRSGAALADLPALHPVALDLMDRGAIDHAFARALAEAGAFDVVINNAGAGHFHASETLPRDVLLGQFELLVFAHIHLSQLALAAMRKEGRGLLINVTSLASRLPVPFTAAYNAAKAAMACFTLTMQMELNHPAIRLVDLQPADIRTDFNDSVVREEKSAGGWPAAMARTWAAVQRNMAEAPGPELVARRIVRLLEEKNPPPRVTVGGFFQTRIAPALFALLPPRVRVWGVRRYYGI